jgi:hypothetical protein
MKAVYWTLFILPYKTLFILVPIRVVFQGLFNFLYLLLWQHVLSFNFNAISFNSSLILILNLSLLFLISLALSLFYFFNSFIYFFCGFASRSKLSL